LLAHGRVRRAFLGISGQYRPLDRRRARELELAAPGGVEVLGVEAGSPAAHAGLREGDLLLAFAGQALHGIDDLQRQLRTWPAGEAAEIELVRAGERVKCRIVPREAG
jgi:S1-C subfamily serine protease